ncbi:MAG TPA: hypothetical protein PLD27_10975 [bacterium]|nr:hypothetical protein [bacterium]HOL47929.1 hypothetical protein [bacterium]HPQ19892.1 hypothetical protein [bacterium]
MCDNLKHDKKFELTNDINDENKIPYFMWDYFLTNREIKEILKSDDENKKIWLIAKILRDAKFTDIWKLVDKKVLLKYWDKIYLRLGQQKQLWKFVIDKWFEYGFIK